MSRPTHGKVITVRGEIEPSALGAVMMHEHLQSDIYDWKDDRLIAEETPATPERRQYLLREAVPLLRACGQYGCHAYVDATMPPWRAWPDVYVEVAEAADVHIVLCTGFYREMEVGTYWVKRPQDRMWPFVMEASADELQAYCVREIVEGIHGTSVRAGAIKLGTSAPEMTKLEIKTFRAGARAQKATGVHVTTHCTRIGAETSQLKLLDEEGVDLSRAVIGHTASHLMDADSRKVCIEWMRRGANFLPTNLGIWPGKGDEWRPLVDAIREIFGLALGDRLVLGLDSGYCSESCEFGPMTFLPPHPFLHMLTHTLPRFRQLGLEEEAIEQMMVENPARILPVRPV